MPRQKLTTSQWPGRVNLAGISSSSPVGDFIKLKHGFYWLVSLSVFFIFLGARLICIACFFFFLGLSITCLNMVNDTQSTLANPIGRGGIVNGFQTGQRWSSRKVSYCYFTFTVRTEIALIQRETVLILDGINHTYLYLFIFILIRYPYWHPLKKQWM